MHCTLVYQEHSHRFTSQKYTDDFTSLFIFMIESVTMPAQSIKKEKKPRVVTILEMKLKITSNVEAYLLLQGSPH
jgi:hypothetical protein